MTEVKIPSWMTFINDSLESHLKAYESPILEILPHAVADRGRCGTHDAFKTHLHHFCLFLCCAKEVSRFCFERATAIDDVDFAVNARAGVGGVDVSEKKRYGYVKTVENVSSDVGEINSVDADVNPRGDRCEAPEFESTHPSGSVFGVGLARLGLLAQPEDYRAWNVLKHPRLDASRELKFGYFILTKHPRSAETFCHLRHVTRRLRRIASHSTSTLCRQGFVKCAEAASRYHGNYHAWDHRRFLVSLLVEGSEEGIVDADAGSILQRELDDVRAWQSSRVSDACPFKYRLFLVETRSKNRVAGMKFDFVEELLELNRLMCVFAGHEALWNHRRDLMKLARREKGAADFHLLVHEDDAFLKSVESKAKNDWEMTLHDRYNKFSDSLKECGDDGVAI